MICTSIYSFFMQRPIIIIHVLMRDEKRKKKEASKVIQTTRQSNMYTYLYVKVGNVHLVQAVQGRYQLRQVAHCHSLCKGIVGDDTLYQLTTRHTGGRGRGEGRGGRGEGRGERGEGRGGQLFEKQIFILHK